MPATNRASFTLLTALALGAAPIATAQDRPALEVPAENQEHDGQPPPKPAVGDAAQRVEQLFLAIQRDEPELARDLFFPLEPFLVLKGIAHPERYWNVLYQHYVDDIHALHETLPEGATFVRFDMTRRGGWVARREEANALPYWASRHDWIVYRVGEREARIEVRTLINWGPRWYVTHLR